MVSTGIVCICVFRMQDCVVVCALAYLLALLVAVDATTSFAAAVVVVVVVVSPSPWTRRPACPRAGRTSATLGGRGQCPLPSRGRSQPRLHGR